MKPKHDLKLSERTSRTAQRIAAFALILAALFVLCACARKAQQGQKQNTEAPEAAGQTAAPPEASSAPTAEPIARRGFTAPVPDGYTESSEHPGSIALLAYDSKDYLRGGDPVVKTAAVYLPFGYDEEGEDRYDVLYLMHGWTGTAGEFFSVLGGRIKNMLDNMIERGDIAPLIVVSASFYNENSDTGFEESIAELREFHRDFRENLVPAVESRFRTFAASVSEEDLIASRDHRAFGGFSMGSITTWNEFCYDSDLIRWYLPMSGGCLYYGGWNDYYPERTCDYFERLIAEKNLDERGFFIYSATGTEDWLKPQVDVLMDEMLKRTAVFTPEHLVYYLKQGGVHSHDAVMEYMYNALPLFFGGEG